TRRDPGRCGRTPLLIDQGTGDRGRAFRSRTTGTPPQRRGPLAAQQPAGIRSPRRFCQISNDVGGGPRSAWVSPVRGKSFLGETKVRLRHRKVRGPGCYAMPKPLQITDLLGLREGLVAGRLSDLGT